MFRFYILFIFTYFIYYLLDVVLERILGHKLLFAERTLGDLD